MKFDMPLCNCYLIPTEPKADLLAVLNLLHCKYLSVVHVKILRTVTFNFKHFEKVKGEFKL